ncbi:type II secretion system protein [Desertibacillus haloalkaliphilus]|uniref:type II secretion system protein n=1 Tax=Desertibacillus haloalkaliphilus TaxID=1328930 RepID=UPI001C275E4E|nr:type II secretion system protein [Desertibacillus haloalkaliphilus]MBU8906558.1 type II secretion system GspH family protein [Desertibacillus haloalkaliphilus]
MVKVSKLISGWLNKIQRSSRVKEERGFTLIEMLAVVTIIGVIAGIAVPSVAAVVENSKERVCEVNLLQLERGYESHLLMENIKHSDEIFTQFLEEYSEPVCDEDCEVIYVDGKVMCSEQSEGITGDPEDNKGDGEPYL